eukprot:2442698-Pleurochrysis_carterae.AAC.2
MRLLAGLKAASKPATNCVVCAPPFHVLPYEAKWFTAHELSLNFACIWVGNTMCIRLLLLAQIIGVPLVWRYLWLEDEKRVLVQFKFSLKNKGSFEKSEWGPWVSTTDFRNNPVTHQVEEVKVCRSAK